MVKSDTVSEKMAMPDLWIAGYLLYSLFWIVCYMAEVYAWIKSSRINQFSDIGRFLENFLVAVFISAFCLYYLHVCCYHADVVFVWSLYSIVLKACHCHVIFKINQPPIFTCWNTLSIQLKLIDCVWCCNTSFSFRFVTKHIMVYNYMMLFCPNGVCILLNDCKGGHSTAKNILAWSK